MKHTRRKCGRCDAQGAVAREGLSNSDASFFRGKCLKKTPTILNGLRDELRFGGLDSSGAAKRPR
jgi:hypothetical protein